MEHETNSITIRDVGNLSKDAVCIYSLDTRRFAYYNSGFLNLFNTTQEEIEARSYEVVTDWIDGGSSISRYHKEILDSHKLQDLEFRLRRQGVEKFVSIDAFLLEDENRLMVIAKDISNSKQHLNYVIEFGARKDALLDMIAHNLSGPLNLTTNLLNAVDQLTKTQQYKKLDKFSRLMRESTQQCIEIINSFLQQEHSESQRVIVQQHVFNAQDKINIVVERIKQFNHDKTFTIKSNTREAMICTDDVKFFQIVHNLLSNAVKFTPPEGVITVNTILRERFFELTVVDSGIGIPEHLQPHIFTRHSPASREGLKGEKSTGMGLYIVKKLAEMMGGTIAFESTEGTGTTFILKLPNNL